MHVRETGLPHFSEHPLFTNVARALSPDSTELDLRLSGIFSGIFSGCASMYLVGRLGGLLWIPDRISPDTLESEWLFFERVLHSLSKVPF